jgi:TetR/AcrR family fatty acid metabolism transcriptional regulator
MRTKDPHKEKTIIDAAIAVFARDGFFDAKIHKIADRARVASGTIYLYFGNKESILLKIFDLAWEQLFGIVEGIHNGAGRKFDDKFELMVDAVFDYFNANPALTIVFVNEQNRLVMRSRVFTKYREKTMALIENLIVQGIDEGRLNTGLNPVILGAFLFGGLRFLLHQWATDPKHYPLESIREDVKKLKSPAGIVNPETCTNK